MTISMGTYLRLQAQQKTACSALTTREQATLQHSETAPVGGGGQAPKLAMRLSSSGCSTTTQGNAIPPSDSTWRAATTLRLVASGTSGSPTPHRVVNRMPASSSSTQKTLFLQSCM